jgi:hypothetical protein
MNKNKQNPPKRAEWIIYKLAREDDKTSLIEDIKEEYEEIVTEKGFKKAQFWYWKHVLRSIFPLIAFTFYWWITTFKNYFKIAYRNIIKYKWYSFISIAGLSVGMTLCILIFLFIRYELSYDRYHKNSEDIFRVVTRQLGNLYQGTDKWAVTPGLLAPTIKSDFPEVIYSARVWRASGLISYRGKVFRESRIFYVDPDFLEIFFSLIFPVIPNPPLQSH